MNLHNTRGILKLNQPTYKYVKYGREKFSCYGVKLWNILPDTINSDKLNDFKDLWDGDIFSCSISL